MEELTTIKQEVKGFLENSNRCRNQDLILWINVNRRRGINIYIDNMKEVVSFESVRRSRQKIQEEYPHLQADKYTQELRDLNEKKFKEVFR